MGKLPGSLGGGGSGIWHVEEVRQPRPKGGQLGRRMLQGTTALSLPQGSG